VGRRRRPGFSLCGFEFRAGCDAVSMHPEDAASVALAFVGDGLGALELCKSLLRSQARRCRIETRQGLPGCHPGADVRKQLKNPAALFRAHDREL
jgi:hypothetical protein